MPRRGVVPGRIPERAFPANLAGERNNLRRQTMHALSCRGRFIQGAILVVLLPTLAAGLPRLAQAAPELIRLEEKFPVGYQYQVSMRTDLTGKLTPPAQKDKPPPRPLTITGDSAFE